MDTDIIRMGKRIVHKGRRTVGPSHDPYTREYVRMERDGKIEWLLVNCGLAGLYVEISGEEVAKRTLHDEDAEAWMVKNTGYDSDFWLYFVWGMRSRAQWRNMTPAQRREYELVREADDKLMRYAM